MTDLESSVPGIPPGDHRAEISLDWLIGLRWGAVAGQLATIAAAQAVLGGLPLASLVALVAALALSNVVLGSVRNRISAPRALCGAALALDTLLLSGLLHATGGPYNPFSVLYLVHITLAAVVLGSRWTWFLTALAVGCYGLLFAGHLPLDHGTHSETELRVHLQGMWVAFSVAAALTAYFVVKLSTAIERRDAAIAEMRERVARHQRLASVTTLAAGAAHELGTPLATIAVASSELERSIRALSAPDAERLAADAGLIRSELERCRAILSRLAADAGRTPGEAPVKLFVKDLVADIVRVLPPSHRGRLTVATAKNGLGITLPRGALLQVAQSLLQNAFEAGDGPVTLSIEVDGPRLKMAIVDRGTGMTREVLARAGEPFFSTKAPGAGLGLGVFIARTLSEQMGGHLRLESRAGQGTTATVELAAAQPIGSASRGD